MAFGQGKVKEEDVFDGRRIWAGIHDGLRVLSKWQAYTFSGLRVDWFDNSFGSFSCGKKSKRYPVPKSDWIPFACTVQLLSNVLFTQFFLFSALYDFSSSSVLYSRHSPRYASEATGGVDMSGLKWLRSRIKGVETVFLRAWLQPNEHSSCSHVGVSMLS